MTAVAVRTAAASRMLHKVQYHSTETSTLASPGKLDRSIASRVPPGSWDSHMHVVDPERFPIQANAQYRPATHTLEDALAFETSVGIQKIVLVQPSIYGYDNSCLLQALRALGPERARGVVTFDADSTTVDQLKRWHRMGVRGVRVNYASTPGDVTFQNMRQELQRYADIIRPLAWVLQVYVPLEAVDALAAAAPDLNIRLCIDHMGKPTLEPDCEIDPYALPGFRSLMTMLQDKNTFVKLSAPYRITRPDSLDNVDWLASEIIKRHGLTKVVFASDWPHTRFEGLDIRPWFEKVLDWTEDDHRLRERLFRGNAEDLWR